MNIKENWKSSAAKLRSTRWLAVMALFLAIRIIASRFRIPVAENLDISLSFIPVALSGMLFGPAAGMAFAFVEDILEFLLFPSGYGFFFGYTLSAMLGVLSYALFLYGQRITIVKVIIAKLISTYLVSVLLGSFWNYILIGGSKAYLAYAGVSFVKNTATFPFQVIAILLVINILLPYLSRRRYITPAQKSPVPFL